MIASILRRKLQYFLSIAQYFFQEIVNKKFSTKKYSKCAMFLSFQENLGPDARYFHINSKCFRREHQKDLAISQ